MDYPSGPGSEPLARFLNACKAVRCDTGNPEVDTLADLIGWVAGRIHVVVCDLSTKKEGIVTWVGVKDGNVYLSFAPLKERKEGKADGESQKQT